LAANGGARIFAEAVAAALTERTHHALARGETLTTVADRAGLTCHPDAAALDALALIADEIAEASELGAAARVGANTAHAHREFAARVAFVDVAVAVVVEAIADVRPCRFERLTRWDLIAAATTGQALRADSRLARVARVTAAGATDAAQAKYLVVEVAVVGPAALVRAFPIFPRQVVTV
jgi:hypothetical protein